MTDPGFELERELTAQFREALDAFGEDARRLVELEVRARQPSVAELEDMIRRVAKEEIARAARATPARPLWQPAALAALMVVGVLGVGWGLSRWGGPADSVSTVQAAPTSQAQPDPVPSAPQPNTAPSPAELAERFDSLFGARDPRLVSAARGATATGVAAAVEDWVAGGSGSDTVVRNALIQMALKDLVDSTLVVDGSILRRPTCRGQTCGALIAYWRGRVDDPRYPPVDQAPDADSAGIAMVERILVLDHGGIL